MEADYGIQRIPFPRARLFSACVGEFFGTYILTLFGTGSVASAVLLKNFSDIYATASVWGMGLSLAVYCSATLSGGHVNPAVTLALALTKRFEWRKVPWYILAQLVGAFVAGLTILALFHPHLIDFEHTEGIIRGRPGSERSAMIFGMYFPNPAMFGSDRKAHQLIGHFGAFIIEFFGTAALIFCVLFCTDPRNTAFKGGAFYAPTIIGTALTLIIIIAAPSTQCGLNPARDLGPRLVSLLSGWGSIAFPGPRGGFWVYTVAPIVGAIFGIGIFDYLLSNAYAIVTEKRGQIMGEQVGDGDKEDIE